MIVLPKWAVQFGYLEPVPSAKFRYFYRPKGAEGLSPGFRPWEPYLPSGEP
jgi:hypothetical protein